LRLRGNLPVPKVSGGEKKNQKNALKKRSTRGGKKNNTRAKPGGREISTKRASRSEAETRTLKCSKKGRRNLGEKKLTLTTLRKRKIRGAVGYLEVGQVTTEDSRSVSDRTTKQRSSREPNGQNKQRARGRRWRKEKGGRKGTLRGVKRVAKELEGRGEQRRLKGGTETNSPSRESL